MLLWHTGNSLLSFCIFFYATCKEGQFDVVKLMVNNQLRGLFGINSIHMLSIELIPKSLELIIHHQFNSIEVSFFASNIKQSV